MSDDLTREERRAELRAAAKDSLKERTRQHVIARQEPDPLPGDLDQFTRAVGEGVELALLQRIGFGHPVEEDES